MLRRRCDEQSAPAAADSGVGRQTSFVSLHSAERVNVVLVDDGESVYGQCHHDCLERTAVV